MSEQSEVRNASAYMKFGIWKMLHTEFGWPNSLAAVARSNVLRSQRLLFLAAIMCQRRASLFATIGGCVCVCVSSNFQWKRKKNSATCTWMYECRLLFYYLILWRPNGLSMHDDACKGARANDWLSRPGQCEMRVLCKCSCITNHNQRPKGSMERQKKYRRNIHACTSHHVCLRRDTSTFRSTWISNVQNWVNRSQSNVGSQCTRGLEIIQWRRSVFFFSLATEICWSSHKN